MEPLLSLIAKGFLLFSHPILIVPIIVTGLLMHRKYFQKFPPREGLGLWGNICLLILFTMIFNVLLKSIFLIPLNPSLGKEGFAFPSGHMQVSVVFYGAILRAYSHRYGRAILLLILTGIGYGLIQQGYHTLLDVLGSIIVGVGTLIVYEKLIHLPFFQMNSAYFGLCLIPIAVVMMGIIADQTGIPPLTSVAFMGLVVIAMGWYFYSRFVAKADFHKDNTS